MTARRSLLAMLLLVAIRAGAATPALVLPDLPLGNAGSRVPVNTLINLSLTFDDAAAAYRDEYRAATIYQGYFNPALCYTYPLKRRTGATTEPDLDERNGHFSPSGPGDAEHGCGGTAFSGNFMNWATSSTIDLLRYGLTGGDRVIDEAGLTVLQRAWLPDGAFHPDFYANPVFFPRKTVGADESGKVSPFAGAPLYIVSCRNRVLFSNTRKGSGCDAPRHGPGGGRLASDKYHGEFNVRVAVCGPQDSPTRPDLCRPYGAHFKPEGSLQQAGTRGPVGLMSYLTEQGAGDPAWYGGVLRAPLKYLGPTMTAAPDWTPGPNSRAEWDAATGVLHANPDGASGQRSGAINYINLLGRSNPARPGAYKVGDPGAELYYEALRYLQARTPSTAAATTDDAMPVWSRRADPVHAACQQNVIATIGHPSFTGDRFVPGNTRRGGGDEARATDGFAPGDAFDVMRATRRIGDMEADAAGTYGNGAPRPDLAGLDKRDDGQGGTGSYYLAGSAYWANTRAIRPDLPVRARSTALELGSGPVAGSSVLYLAAKYGGFDDRNGDGNPFATTEGRRDNTEWSADGQGPAGWHAASAPHLVVAAARALLLDGGANAAWMPGPLAASSAHQGKGFLVQAAFHPATWSGTLQRRALALTAAGDVTVARDADWDAARILDGSEGKPGMPAPAQRKLFTMAEEPGKGTATIAFDWPSLPAPERAALDAAAPGLPADGRGADRVAFLRGERKRELGQPDGVFRRRSSVLGDIIRSVSLLVGAPSPSVQGENYADFYRTHQGRRTMVYVGANDGMLHGFDSASGVERFAYLPRALLPFLGALSNPGYLHRPYVDASPASAEASWAGRWRTVLASGMGMGARGVFALDITDADQFDQGLGALWEFTERDDPSMGHVHAPPLIVKLRMVIEQGKPRYRYFVMVASGINPASADGSAALFLLALDKAPTQAWQRGVNYFRFATPAQDKDRPNALAPPAVVIGGDGSVRRAYAGDLHGKLWRFDFGGTAPWTGALHPSGQPLFAARDAEGRPQPISHAARAAFAPGGGYLVLFGTGKFIEERDLSDAFTAQSFYAVHDSDAAGAPRNLSRADLAPRTLTGAARLAVSGGPANLHGPAPKAGWYFDFPAAHTEGERVGGSPLLAGGAVVFDSLLPGREACAPPATRRYVLDAQSGMALGADGVARDREQTGERSPGISGAPALLIATGGSTGPPTPAGTATAVHTYAIVRPQAAGGAGAGQPLRVAFQAGRLSWREVANWPDLHQAAGK